MLFDAFAELNWLAVLVAGLAYFVLGAIWYSTPLFGKQYRAALGLDPNQAGTPDPKMLGTNLIGWLVAALALGLISESIEASTWADGLVLGLTASVGFIGTNRIVAGAYEGPNTALMRVNAPYTVLGYVLMGIILAVWP